jgi:iron uptake system EfeUOB component EfeO/EfeM
MRTMTKLLSARLRGWRGRLWLGVALVAAAASVTGATVAGQGTASAALPGGAQTVTERACGTPPARLPAGRLVFQVTNAALPFVTIYVIGSAGEVYAEIPSLTPHHSLPLATTLAAGRYRLRCVFTNGAVRTSAAFTVTGTATGAVAGYLPLPDLALGGPVMAYSRWIEGALPGLLTASRKLDGDVAAGHLAQARADWLTAHLDYERLGAAYNSFGTFDDELNGMANGLPEGTASPGWTGFFAIEYALWHGWPAGRLRPLTRTLVSDVRGLIADFPSEEIDPGDLPLRAHEILENSLQFQLTGMDDYGSGTTLATCYANTQGTAEVLSVLASLISARDPVLLASIRAGLALVQGELLAARSPRGDWTPLHNLPTQQRQRLDGDLGQLLEQLAVIPNLLYPRTSA